MQKQKHFKELHLHVCILINNLIEILIVINFN